MHSPLSLLALAQGLMCEGALLSSLGVLTLSPSRMLSNSVYHREMLRWFLSMCFN